MDCLPSAILDTELTLSPGCLEDDGDWTGKHPHPQGESLVSLRALPSGRMSPRNSFIVLIIIATTIVFLVAVTLC